MGRKPKPVPEVIREPTLQPPYKGKMYEITHHTSVGSRYQSYVREMEQLCSEVEDFCTVLADNPDARAIKYIHDRLKERLDKIHAASKVDAK